MNTEGNKTQQFLKLFPTLFARGVHFVYTNFIEPKSETEDSQRHEFILNVILLGSIVIAIILDIFLIASLILEGDAYNGISIIFFSGIVLFYVLLLFLSRKGYSRHISYILIILYFLVTMHSALEWGVELPVVLLGSVITIIVSSILISTRASFIVTFFVSCALVVIAYLHITGMFPENRYWRQERSDMKSPIQLSFILLIITTVSWLSNREIERSLARARASENELLKERDLLEIKVEERTKELKQTQRDKITELYRFAEFGKLSSGIFHDLMNPLQAVISNINQIESSSQNFPETKQYLEKAVAASRRMGDFISSVKKQIQTTHTEQMFSLTKELEEAIDILEYKARESGLILHRKNSKELLTYGNPLKFHQICLNLLSNAIDASEGMEGDRAVIHIHLTKRDKFALLKVTDHGCGIEETVLQKIFDPFFTTKYASKGVGLGLSTTKDIVEKDFQGTIEVHSILEKGTSFAVLIPLRTHDSLHNERTHIHQ